MWKFNQRYQEEATEGGEGQVVEVQAESLIDGDSELTAGEWLLMDGIKGVGERPEFMLEKYNNLYEQAKAYPELQKKFGSFTGAPKEGYALPEEFDAEDELAKRVIEWSTKNNLNQSGFEELMQLAIAQSSAVEQVSREAELAKLGQDADRRIKQVEAFLKQKAGDSYEEIKGLVTNADSIILVEKIMKAIQPPKLPIDGVEVEGKPTWEAIEREMYRKDEHGNLLRSVSREHEMKIQRMMKEYGGDRPNQRIVNG